MSWLLATFASLFLLLSLLLYSPFVSAELNRSRKIPKRPNLPYLALSRLANCPRPQACSPKLYEAFGKLKLHQMSAKARRPAPT